MTIEPWYWQAIEAIDYPFPQRMHPDIDWLEREIIAWSRTHHLVQSQEQINHIRAMLLAEFVARANADLRRPVLRLIGLWTVWFFFLDDLTDTIPSVESLADFHLHILSATTESITPTQEHPLISAVASLWDELRQYAGPITQVRFYRAFVQTLEAHLWEVSNRTARVQPDSATYTAMRLWSGAFFPMIALIDAARDFVLPSYLFEHAMMRELFDAAARAVLWYNDLWSYPKERRTNDSPHNIVHIIAREEHLSLREAVDRVIAQHDQSLQCFLALKQHLQHLDGESPQVRYFVEGVAAWLRATQDWSHRTIRYRTQMIGAIHT
ncbi:MAG: terpene synthase family protein [Roseiflexus sp.]